MRTRFRRYSIAWLCGAAALGCGSNADPTAAKGDQASTAGASANTAGVSSSAETAGSSADSSMAGSQAAGSSGVGQSVAGAAGQARAGAGGRAQTSAGAGASGSSVGGGRAMGGTGSAANGGMPTLFYLSNGGAQILRSNADGSARKAIVQGKSAGVGPDGVAVDVAAGHVFWTNMGSPSADDGSIVRADLDGRNVTTVVADGGTFTPKQLKLDAQNGKLYWSDREGMRVMRANLDGSMLETLVTTGSGDKDRADASRWCVGIAIDLAAGKFYWSQKGGDNAHQGTIKRANLSLPSGQTAANRADIEVLFKNLPEPIDLDLDLDKRMLYWTDRGDNTVSRAPMEPAAGFDAAARTDREIVVRGLGEAIGIALDVPRGRMFYTSLAGIVASAALDGSNAQNVLSGQGALTGIALADLLN